LRIISAWAFLNAIKVPAGIQAIRRTKEGIRKRKTEDYQLKERKRKAMKREDNKQTAVLGEKIAPQCAESRFGNPVNPIKTMKA
jgi:hypothetical protein